MEFQILDFIQSHFRCPLGDAVFPYITALGNYAALWIITAVVLLIIPKTRKIGILVAVSLAIEILLNNGILKNLVARTRPFDINTSIQLLISRPTDYSFPSGHSGAAFAVTAALIFAHCKLWIPSLCLSILIAFSRLYFYVHFPTDVLGGIALGFLSAFLAKLLLDFIAKKRLKQTDTSSC